MCHLQPKVVVALVMRARGGISALLDLLLKKLGCLQHCDNQKAPFGAPQQINACELLFVPCCFLSRRPRIYLRKLRREGLRRILPSWPTYCAKTKAALVNHSGPSK